MLSILNLPEGLKLSETWKELHTVYLNIKKNAPWFPNHEMSIELSERIKNRLDKGKPFLPSASNPKQIIYIVSEYSTREITKHRNAKMLVDLSLKFPFFKGVYQDSFIVTGFSVFITNVPPDNEEFYLCKLSFGPLSELLKKIKRTSYYTQEKWINIASKRAKDLITPELTFLVSCYAPLQPVLFQNLNIEQFVTMMINKPLTEITYLPSSYEIEVDLMLPSKKKAILTGTDHFRDKIGQYFLPSDYDYVYEIILNQVFLTLSVMTERKPLITRVTPIEYDYSLTSSRIASNLNLGQCIIFVGNKASGKTTLKMRLEKIGYMVVDSDDYGKFLTLYIYLKETNTKHLSELVGECIFADNFRETRSYIETLAKEFLSNIGVSTVMGVYDLRAGVLTRFANMYSKVCAEVLPISKFYDAVGVYAAGKKLVIFCHSSFEAYPAMGPNVYSLQPPFSESISILYRNRDDSDLVTQVFLQYFYSSISLYANETYPTKVLIDAVELIEGLL